MVGCEGVAAAGCKGTPSSGRVGTSAAIRKATADRITLLIVEPRVLILKRVLCRLLLLLLLMLLLFRRLRLLGKHCLRLAGRRVSMDGRRVTICAAGHVWPQCLGDHRTRRLKEDLHGVLETQSAPTKSARDKPSTRNEKKIGRKGRRSLAWELCSGGGVSSEEL